MSCFCVLLTRDSQDPYVQSSIRWGLCLCDLGSYGNKSFWLLLDIFKNSVIGPAHGVMGRQIDPSR